MAWKEFRRIESNLSFWGIWALCETNCCPCYGTSIDNFQFGWFRALMAFIYLTRCLLKPYHGKLCACNGSKRFWFTTTKVKRDKLDPDRHSPVTLSIDLMHVARFAIFLELKWNHSWWHGIPMKERLQTTRKETKQIHFVITTPKARQRHLSSVGYYLGTARLCSIFHNGTKWGYVIKWLEHILAQKGMENTIEKQHQHIIGRDLKKVRKIIYLDWLLRK